jgi:hypothetical protein
MRRLLPLFAALLAACSQAPRTAVNPRADFKAIKRVAVVGFQGPNGDLAADYLTQSLVARGANVVERRQLAAILAERKMTENGLLDTSTIKKVGKILGVDALFIGTVAKSQEAQSYMVTDTAAPGQQRRRGRSTVTPVGGRTVSPGLPVLGVPGAQVVTTEAAVSVVARMVDARTGSVLWSGTMKEIHFEADEAMLSVTDSFVDSLAPHWPQLAPKAK